MIRYLTGTILDISEQTVVVGVRGIGYLVHVTSGYGYVLKQDVALWTHLAVRETALDLYGFPTRDELEVFELLLTLPKIGPKSALQILTQADIELLKQAVAEQDASYLAKLSGIGKKTAEKIVLELKDKFADAFISGAGETSGSAAGFSGATTTHTDLIDALLALGYSPQDAREAAKNVPPDVTDTSVAIKHALQRLGK